MTDTVGAVYVRVMSDTKSFAKQLRKDLAKTGGVAGDDAGKAFGKEFDDRVSRSLANIDVERILGPQIKGWGRNLAKEVRAAEKAGGQFRLKPISVDQIISTDELAKLSKRLRVPIQDLASFIERDMVAAYRKGFTDLDSESAALASKQKARDTKRVDLWLKEMRRIRPLSDVWGDVDFKGALAGLGDEIKRTVTPAMEDALKRGARVDWLDTADAEAKIRAFATEYRLSFADAERAVRKEMQRTVAEREASLSWFAKSRRGFRTLITDSAVLDTRMKRLYQSFRKMGTGGWWDTITTGFGGLILLSYRAGRAMSGLVASAGKGLTAVGGAISGVASKLGVLEGSVGGLGGMLTGVGQGVTKLFSSGVAGVAALVAGLAILVSVIGAVAQIVSALVAGLVAAGSALYFVVSQAVFLLPIVGALGLGFAAVAIGGWDAAKSVGLLVKAMNEGDPKKRAEAWKAYADSLKDLGPNAREAVKALRPLLNGFADLKKNSGEALFDGMAAAIGKAKPLIDALKTGLVDIAGAVGDVIDGFLALGEDTKFMEDFNTMMGVSTSLIRDLGAASKDVFAGLNSFFAAMEPVLTAFGEDLAGIADEFKNWAQSDSGQASILEFFTTAREMSKLFWDMLKEAGGALHDLFTAPATIEAAKALLTWITEKMQEFRTFIAEASADGRLEQWFNNAKVAGQVLWDVMSGLMSVFRALLTPESLAMLKFIGAAFSVWISLLISITRLVSGAAYAFRLAFTVVKVGVLGIINGFKLVVDAVGRAVERFNAARTAGKSMADSIKSAINGMRDAWDRFVARMRSIKWPTPPAWMSKAWGAVTGNSANGGMFMGPTKRLIGEEGPEAVIPLHRPLSRVDPSVRNMAAMMRGGAGAGAGGSSYTRQMTNYWTVNTPSPDGRVVASQIVNRMAAMA